MSEPGGREGEDRGGRRIAKSSRAFLSLQHTLQQQQRRPRPSTNIHPTPHPSASADRVEPPTDFSAGIENMKIDMWKNPHWSDDEEECNVETGEGEKWGHSGWERQQNAPPGGGNRKQPHSIPGQNNSPRVAGNQKHHSSRMSVEDLRRHFQNLDRYNLSLKRIENAVCECAEGLGEEVAGWEELVDDWIFRAAVVKGFAYVDLAVQVSLRLIENSMFQSTVHNCFIQRIGSFMRSPNLDSRKGYQEAKNLCHLIAKYLIASWPPRYDSCVREVNEILFAVLSVFQGWLNVLEHPDRNAPENVFLCSEALVFICLSAGRKLWLKWPDIVDKIYSVLRPLIVGSSELEDETKYKLLDLFVKLNEWPKPDVNRSKPYLDEKTVLSVSVQTDESSMSP